MATKVDYTLEQNLNRLVEILTFIDATLAWIVGESGLIEDEFQETFQALLPDAQDRIAKAIEYLQSVDTEDHPFYQGLREHGLTNGALNLKARIGASLRRTVEESAEDEQGVPTILGWSLKHLLKWFNLILGSLGEVIPGLGAVKEYKEAVELATKQRQKAPVWNLPRYLGS